MQISGFLIIRDAIINDYPVVEAIRSALPVVDEMIVLIGDCKDNTEALIRSINSDKIKIHHSVWNAQLREGGQVLADETNKAFRLIDKKSDWAFCLQADEVLHEKYVDEVYKNCLRFKENKKVQGLLFNYLHFYGAYSFTGNSRRWYKHEVRIIRNDTSITAYKDAQGFRMGNKKLNVKDANAFIYHYGWVKHPVMMTAKIKNSSCFWHNDSSEKLKELLASKKLYNYTEYDSLRRFKGTHPLVMNERIHKQNWNTDIDPDKRRMSFTEKILFYIETVTGKRIFTFTNYKRI